MRRAFVPTLIPLVFVLACSGTSTTGPSSPSPVPATTTTPIITISGRVIDSQTRTGISNATVVFAPTSGGAVASKKATTGGAGDYVVSGLWPAGFTVNVFATNYFGTTKAVTLTADTTQSFELDRWPEAALTHTLTITASPSCAALPDAAKKRTYPVQVHDRGDRGLVVLVVNSYEIMVGMANEPGFIGRRNGDSVRFDVTDDMLADFAMIERIPGVGDMGYVGTGTGTIDSAGRIVATFDGEFRIGYGSPSPMTCRASDHRMEFAPAGK
jgi:hypothetical protein